MKQSRSEDAKTEEDKDQVAAVPKKTEKVSFKKIYSLQTDSQKCLVIGGCIFAFINGALLPNYAVILGLSTESFNPSLSEAERDEKLRQIIILAAIVCSMQFVLSWANYTIMQQQAEKMACNLKSRYLNALMKQETSYFE